MGKAYKTESDHGAVGFVLPAPTYPAQAEAASNEPPPLPDGRPAVLAFDPAMVPDVIGNYVMDVSGRQQSPPDFVAVAAVCALSGLIGTRARIQPKQHDKGWQVPANLWGMIVGRPSAMKSPAMRAALAPLEAMERLADQGHQAAMIQYKIDSELARLAGKESQKQASKALARGSADDARAFLESDLTPDEPAPRRYLINDATVEKLGELLNQNPTGLTLVRDELYGWLAFNQTEAGASSRAFYLEAYNGLGSFTYDRIGRGHIRIETACLALIGGIQPSRLHPLIAGAQSGTADDGLIQRLQMAVWPDDIREWRWLDQAGCEFAESAYQNVFKALDRLDQDNSLTLKFSNDAQTLFIEWMEQIQTEARSGELSPTLEAHWLKMPQTVARLALIFALVAGGREDVGEHPLLMALAWGDYLKTHARRIYAIGAALASDNARLILSRKNKLGATFTARDLHKKDWAGLTDRSAVLDALNLLVECRYLERIEQHSHDITGGRPTVIYAWRCGL